MQAVEAVWEHEWVAGTVGMTHTDSAAAPEGEALAVVDIEAVVVERRPGQYC